jgi:mRNA interferase MazF
VTNPPRSPRRGDIYWTDFNPSRGSEQAGYRPAVVVSLDSFNVHMPVVMVAAITTKIKPAYTVTVILPAGKPLERECQILAFQIMTVDKSRLDDYMACLEASQLEELENAMRRAWGL